MPVVNSEERLRSLLETLEECQSFLVDETSSEAARLLSLAILELRMELHKVTDSELKALCDLVVTDGQLPRDVNDALVRRLPPYLKVVK